MGLFSVSLRGIAETVPLPERVVTRSTVPAAQSAPKLPENIRLIIGKSEIKNYYPRLRAIHTLSNDLPESQVEALYTFLYDRLEDQRLPDLQFNGLKNEIVLKLMQQNRKPAALAGHLVAMYKNKDFDPTWRDYCVQFFGKWYEQAPRNVDRQAMIDCLHEALSERDSGIGGTAITMLGRLTHLEEFDKNKIAKLAFELMTAPDCDTSGKTSAMQICAELRYQPALQVARDWVRNSSEIFNRMSAIAAIGMLGNAADLPLLEEYENSRDIRLRGPAQAAIKRIKNTKNKSKINHI